MLWLLFSLQAELTCLSTLSSDGSYFTIADRYHRISDTQATDTLSQPSHWSRGLASHWQNTGH